jgi:hypothetical protein
MCKSCRPIDHVDTIKLKKNFKFDSVNLDPDGYEKKCVTVRLRVKYDSQATNRKQGELPMRAPLPPPHSYWQPDSQPPKYTKIPPETSGSFYFLIAKSPKTAFFK